MFFFFKQKTAYEMLRSLVGSEMCIRDRDIVEAQGAAGFLGWIKWNLFQPLGFIIFLIASICLLYTSDAADDLLCVDLGGRRIIKKKKLSVNAETYHDH